VHAKFLPRPLPQVTSTSSSSDLPAKENASDDHTYQTTTSLSSSTERAQSDRVSQSSSAISKEAELQGRGVAINCKVVVYAALSGMVSFFSDGTIHSCNQHFALMLFGYSQEELQNKVRRGHGQLLRVGGWGCFWCSTCLWCVKKQYLPVTAMKGMGS